MPVKDRRSEIISTLIELDLPTWERVGTYFPVEPEEGTYVHAAYFRRCFRDRILDDTSQNLSIEVLISDTETSSWGSVKFKITSEGRDVLNGDVISMLHSYEYLVDSYKRYDSCLEAIQCGWESALRTWRAVDVPESLRGSRRDEVVPSHSTSETKSDSEG